MLAPVYSAINEHLVSLNMGLPIAWENTTPPDIHGAWLAVFLVPGEEDDKQSAGEVRIRISAPTGKGWAELQGIADYIQRSLRTGTVLVYDGQRVTITGSSRTGGRVENGWYGLSLAVQWRVVVS